MTEIFWNQIFNLSRGGGTRRLARSDAIEWIAEVLEEVQGDGGNSYAIKLH